MGLFDSPPDLSQFDPGPALGHAADVISGVVGNAVGGSFSVTIRNPTDVPINYSINGEAQIALLARMQRVHSGTGRNFAEIQFDRALGDGSVFDYNLASGQSYSFQFVRVNLPDFPDANMLNLFMDRLAQQADAGESLLVYPGAVYKQDNWLSPLSLMAVPV